MTQPQLMQHLMVVHASNDVDDREHRPSPQDQQPRPSSGGVCNELLRGLSRPAPHFRANRRVPITSELRPSSPGQLARAPDGGDDVEGRLGGVCGVPLVHHQYGMIRVVDDVVQAVARQGGEV